MELVRNFLKNKGLKSVLSELDAVSKNDPIEGSISGEMMEIENASSAPTRFNNEGMESLEMDNTIYNCISEYLRLRHWVMSSLDNTKRELFALCYPIFEHIYIAMIRCNAFNEASVFMKNWGEDYRSIESTKDEVVKLASIMSRSGAKSNFFTEGCLDIRHERIQMRVSPNAYGLFMNFLNENNMFLIMAIINDEVLYLIDDSRYNLQNISTTTFTNKLRLFDQHDHGGSEIVHSGVFGGETRELSPVVFQKDSTSIGTNGCSMFYAEIFEKSSKRQQILDQCVDIMLSPSSIIWPSYRSLRNFASSKSFNEKANFSLLYATMTNSYDNISCMDIGGLSGSQIACGFQDGCIRTWPDDIEESHFYSTLEFFDHRNFLFVSPELKQNQEISKGQHRRNAVQSRMVDLCSLERKCIELRGHDRAVYSICQDKSGMYMLTTSGDETVRLWNTESYRCVAKYYSFGPSWNVDISPWGHYFATSNHNCSAVLYTLEYDTPLRIFVGHNSDVNSCKFHPNESYLVSGGDDCSVRVWDIRAGTSSQIYRNAPAPINVVAICSAGNNVAVGCKNGNILLYDISAGKRVALFDGHDGSVNSLSFSPDGYCLCSGADDDSIRLWNLHNLPTYTDGAGITSDNFRYHTKFSSVSSINFANDHMIYAGGIFTLNRPPSDDNRLKHNVRDEVIDVACDFGLERVK